MNYSDINTQLFKDFNLEKYCTPIGNTGHNIYSINFKSLDNTNLYTIENNENIRQTFFGYNSLSYRNLNFNYPVIVPKNPKAGREAIILLHGLNERNWNKYLPWAYRLAENTGKSVILFPLAFHMNRSPESWKDPRQMKPFVLLRQRKGNEIQNSSVANIALSERLSSEPEQFFLSGYQSAMDLVQLITSINKGEHPLFELNTKINFFAYSIGAFLAEILFLSNQKNLFENSKIFLFCGGSAFSELNGNSRYILDSFAFKTIKKYYARICYDSKNKKSIFNRLMFETSFGQSFQDMLSVNKFNKIPGNKLNKFSEQIKVAGLLNDKVVPVAGLKKTLKKVEIMFFDFDYEYSHEMPFPENHPTIKEKVNKAFDSIFDYAALQLG